MKNSVNIVLNKLEGNFNPVPQNQNVKQIFNQNVSQEDDMISSEIVKDLNTKSIDELLLIYFNQDDYVYEFTQKIRTNNEKLLGEVSELSENTEKLKSQYEDVKFLVEDFKKQNLEKENELKELYSQKQLIDSNFTVEKLIEEMRKSIEDNYQKPRQKLINEFLSKKIDMETFKESFKELSVKYHYYNLIKDKLNLYK
jgi:DNA repair ATPase RecN